MQEEIKEAVESLCSYLPQELQGACKAFVEQYGDRVVELLLRKLDAHAICTELGLCKENEKNLVKPNVLPSVVLSPADTLPLQPIATGTPFLIYLTVVFLCTVQLGYQQS